MGRSPIKNNLCSWSRSIPILFFTSLLSSSNGYGDIVFMNTSFISNTCSDSCNDIQITYVLQNDCHRGCRLYDLSNRNSIFTQFDEATVLKSCNESCSEAYANKTTSEEACKEGCKVAQREYYSMLGMSRQWLYEFHRNRTFFETFLDITSAIVFPVSTQVDTSQATEKYSNRDKNRRIHLKIKPVLRSEVSPRNNKTFTAEVTRESYSMPEWVSLSALALSMIGTVFTISICCYCCLFAKIIKEKSNKSIDSDSPPSYEQLLTNGLLMGTETNLSVNVKMYQTNDRTINELADDTNSQRDPQVLTDADPIEVHNTSISFVV